MRSRIKLVAAFAELITLTSILSRTMERKSLPMPCTFSKKIGTAVVSAVLSGFQNVLTAAVMADSERKVDVSIVA